MNNKRNSRENESPLLKGTGLLDTQASGMAEVLNAFLAPVFTIKTDLQEPEVSEGRRKILYGRGSDQGVPG